MADPSLDLRRELVDGYLMQLRGWTGDNHWTWNVLDSLVSYRPDLAWPILREVLDRVPDDTIPLVAAGPLEDLLARHGHGILPIVEAAAAEDPRLRQAMWGVWQQGMPEDVWARVVAMRSADRPDWEREADDDDPDADMQSAAAAEWLERRVEVESMGGPPRPGSRDAIDTTARMTLLEAIRQARPDLNAWTTPVSLEVVISTGLEPPSVALPDAIAGIVEAIRADRPSGLVADDASDVAVISHAGLIREVSARELRSRTPSYQVALRRMVDEQSEAMDDPRSWDEMMAEADSELADLLGGFDDPEAPAH